MARINKGRTAVVFGGIILAVLFWVFCISFTVAMIQFLYNVAKIVHIMLYGFYGL